MKWLLANTSADPERMFIGGASAGAVTALTLAFSADDVGVPDPPRFLGVVDLWGLIFQLEHVEAAEPAIFVVHGEVDGTVPFLFSDQLVARATEVALPLEFHPVPGADHGFANVPFFTEGPEPGRHLPRSPDPLPRGPPLTDTPSPSTSETSRPRRGP